MRWLTLYTGTQLGSMDWKKTKNWYDHQTQTSVEKSKDKYIMEFEHTNGPLIQAREPDHSSERHLLFQEMEELKIRTGKSGKVSRFGKRIEESLEYICDSCSHCGWSIRSSMHFREGAGQN